MIRQSSTSRSVRRVAFKSKLLALVCLAAMLGGPSVLHAQGQVDASTLPRLQGATAAAGSSTGSFNYSAPGTMSEVASATRRLLADDGWKQFVAPLEEQSTSLLFKKGPQGLTVYFTMAGGRANQSSVNYVPTWLLVDLPFPDGATDIVYDANRPYLNGNAPGTVDTLRAFFDQELTAKGWSRLSEDAIAARWPGARLEQPAGGALAVYGRDKQLPVLLALARRADDRINVEIKVAPFSQPQMLEVGNEMGGMPIPKPIKSSGYTGTDIRRQVHAHVPAEMATVLAFYRRELLARKWTEETRGAVVNADEVALTFTSPTMGTAAMKLSHRYDLTIVNFTVEASAAMLAAKAKAERDENDNFLKQALEIAGAPTSRRPAAAAPPAGAAPALGLLADNTAPIPLPATAEDIEFEADDGKLEFTSTSSVSALAAFFRTTMKPLGWREQPSVINNPNMTVLDFSKAGKKITLTVMQMGAQSNVTAIGPGLMAAASRPANASKGGAAAPPAPKVEVNLEPEAGAALPVPTQRTLSAPSTVKLRDGDEPFRRELDASIPADLSAVLAFYRRELTKLDWKELPQGAVTRPDKLVLAFSSPQGPALLKLGRSNGETSINLTQKIPAEASKAGVMPPPGKAKLFFGNMGDVEVSITINKKIIKIPAGTGGPDTPGGPTLELAPGKYRYSVNMPGKPARNDQVEVGADDTWGLMAGPGGGVLSIQLY